jgi:hypothetical protein
MFPGIPLCIYMCAQELCIDVNGHGRIASHKFILPIYACEAMTKMSTGLKISGPAMVADDATGSLALHQCVELS